MSPRDQVPDPATPIHLKYGRQDISFVSTAEDGNSVGDASMMSAQSLEEQSEETGGTSQYQKTGSGVLLPLDDVMISEIRFSAQECQERGLVFASRWYVTCVLPTIIKGNGNPELIRAAELVLSIHPRRRLATRPPFTVARPEPRNEAEEEEEDDIVVAQNHMRERSYHKVIRSLARYTSARSMWLRTYSEFLVRDPP